MKGGRSGVLGVIAAVVAVVVAVAILGKGPDNDRPYRLNSNDSSGFSVLKMVLEGRGYSVRSVAPNATDVDVLFVTTPDTASRRDVDRWRAFAEGGGVVILGSSIEQLGGVNTELAAPAYGAELRPGNCGIDVLSGSGELPSAKYQQISVEAEQLLTAEGDTRMCFTDEHVRDVGAISEATVGEGRVFTLAAPEMATNGALLANRSEAYPPPLYGYLDNGPVMEALVSTGRGTRVGVVPFGATTGGAAVTKGSMWSFVRPGIRLGLWQLVAAVVVFALASAWRRRPSPREPQPVEIAGIELVDAVGDLMRRRRSPESAARRLRQAEIRRVCAAIGLVPTTDGPTVVQRVALLTGRDPDAVSRLMWTAPVTTDDELVTLSRDLDTLYQEVRHGHTTAN